uniref:Uncharacterized protein n=1 Tax=Roseihalotalea indica TaxID=2867963 RepID=A0AA49GMM5_9BACT|nr:hypothetical protein K4G66_29890 [Tunicatimonas sp. TK19036]
MIPNNYYREHRIAGFELMYYNPMPSMGISDWKNRNPALSLAFGEPSIRQPM